MKKLTSFCISILFILNICSAQLNKLCPISSTVYDKDKIKGLNLLLDTKDCTPFLVKNGKTTLTSTVQLVNATQPFPPLWFQMGNPQTDTGGFFETTFLLDIRIQKESGNLTFFSSYPGSFFGSTTFDTATLQPIDSLTTYKTAPAGDKFILDPHEYQVDKAGNKLFANKIRKKIDARCLSGLEKDSVRIGVINEILIVNKDDSVLLQWDPLEHLSVCEMNWAYKDVDFTYGNAINWSHANSIRFANDGNIIYSLRHVGMGKINRKTGEIMWKLGGKDTLNSIRLADTANYYLQHDFLQQEGGLYTVFSNGDDQHPYLEVLTYKIDEENKTAELVSRYKPEPNIYSNAMGSYECKGDTCIVNFGVYIQKTPEKTQEMGKIWVGKKLVATLAAPPGNFAYKVLQTKWNAAQRRPKVSLLKGGMLRANSLDGLHDYTWYKIEGNNAIPVGSGKIFTPTVSGKYVVEAQQGTGLFRSYLVSDVFIYTYKKS